MLMQHMLWLWWMGDNVRIENYNDLVKIVTIHGIEHVFDPWEFKSAEVHPYDGHPAIHIRYGACESESGIQDCFGVSENFQTMEEAIAQRDKLIETLRFCKSLRKQLREVHP